MFLHFTKFRCSQVYHDLIVSLCFCFEYRSFLIFSDCPVLVSYSQFLIKNECLATIQMHSAFISLSLTKFLRLVKREYRLIKAFKNQKRAVFEGYLCISYLTFW